MFINYCNRSLVLKSVQICKYHGLKSFSTTTANQKYGKQFKFGVLGVPFELGQTKTGVSLGPKAIRNAGLINAIKAISSSIEVQDYGDIEYSPTQFNNLSLRNFENLKYVSACNEKVSLEVQEILRDERICITLGGDHAIAIGSIDGHLKYNNNFGVIWVDAHADINTNATSPSGNAHGMPMALLARELADYWPYIPGMDWQKPVISIKDLVYIGLRSVDDYEREFIDKFNIKAFGMREIDNLGIKEVIRQTIEHFKDKNSLHVSFDIDALDALEVPSTGTAVRGGLTLREGILLMEEIYKTQKMKALDLVEVNPKIGSKEDVDKTVEAAINIILAACGNSRLGNNPLKFKTKNLQK